jgi:uncharacterized membrane protein
MPANSWFSNPVVPKSRVEAISDAVFAIAATLLVVELKVPHFADAPGTATLAQGLIEAAPQVGSFVLSFLIITVSWVNHHQILVNLKHCDRHFLWINGFLLLCVSFVPFPTATLGEYPTNAAAIVFYGIANSILAGAFVLMRIYVNYCSRMSKVVQAPARHKQALRRSAMAPLLYGTGIAVAFVMPIASWLFFLAVPVYFALPAANEEV